MGLCIYPYWGVLFVFVLIIPVVNSGKRLGSPSLYIPKDNLCSWGIATSCKQALLTVDAGASSVIRSSPVTIPAFCFCLHQFEEIWWLCRSLCGYDCLQWFLSLILSWMSCCIISRSSVCISSQLPSARKTSHNLFFVFIVSELNPLLQILNFCS